MVRSQYHPLVGLVLQTYVRNTRAVQKDTEHFFLIYCCTYNLIRLVSFKVLPSTVDTPLPAFFPVLGRVLERVLRDGAKVL